MPRAAWFREWLDEGVGNRYPFADSATLDSGTGLVLDRDLVRDAVLYPVGGTEGLRVTSVSRVGAKATLYVGTTASPTLCSASWPAVASAGSLPLADRYGRPAGLLVTDATLSTAAAGWPEGDTHFPEGATEFAASCCVYVPAGGCLRGFLLPDGTLVTGDVWFVGADGVIVTEDDNHNIRFDVVGDPLFKRKQCGVESGFTTPSFVRTINGVAPDAYGNWQVTPGDLVSDTALRVVTKGGGVVEFSAVGKTIA